MSDLIAYKSNALVEASYKLTLQEQRFLLLCISELKKSGADAELQETMTITAAEYLIHSLTWGGKMPRFSYRKRSIVCQRTGRSCQE